MFNWFRKKREEVLEFPDNAAAFAHACSVGYPPLIGALIPALVAEEGGGGAEGERTFLISAATAGGAVEFWSCTLKEAQFHPKAGDLVGFRIVTIASDLPVDASLIGYIACRLDRVLSPRKGWVISQNYTPKDIKQPIRW